MIYLIITAQLKKRIVKRMAYVHFLAAWQHQDYEQIKEIVADDVKVTIVFPDRSVKELDNAKILSIFEERFKHEQDWTFDVIYKTERGDESIVVIRIAREDVDQNPVEKASLCIFTFATVGDRRQLIRAYMETGLTDKF